MAKLILERTKRKALFYKEVLSKEPSDIGLEMTKIPAGGYWMGTPEEEIERLCKEYNLDYFRRESPQHWVDIPTFFIGKYPINQAQWRVVAEWDQVEQKLDPDPSQFEGDDLPVERVSWLDAKEFCARLSKKTKRPYRLPSEAEWEYACRGVLRDDMTAKITQEEWNRLYHQPFHFGETLSDEVANYDANNVYGRGVKGEYRQKTTPVGTFPANNFGLWDMHGNVWEWCEDDWHRNYKQAPTDGSAWIENNSTNKVWRGGAWDYVPRNCRSASRDHNVHAYWNSYLGFRVACSPPGFP